MLTLAAYRLETPTLTEDGLHTCWSNVIDMVEGWLKKKGIADISCESGSFESETDGKKGEFTRSSLSSVSGMLTEIVLSEPAKDGHIFITSVAVTQSEEKVSVFLTLAAMNSGHSIAPIAVYPRCPVLVREILILPNDWTFGGSEVYRPVPIRIAGKKAASTLSGYLMNENRTLPVTVVSELDGEPIWSELPEKLAIDLAGLSSVVRIDGEASWALNDLLGKSRSCYLGAVRLYWPLRGATRDPSDLSSELWTAERLLSNDSDAKGLPRFMISLRRQVMSIAALAVDAPASIRRIKSEHSRARLAELQEKANANSEELELARLFIEENETLKDELEKAKAESSRQAARAEAAENAIEVLKAGGSDTTLDEQPENDAAPKTGEVRYYKKTHSKPSYDVLVRISDCSHNSWQATNKADKAKKGIERVEGSSEWKSVFHCGSCKGGGVWKVTW